MIALDFRVNAEGIVLILTEGAVTMKAELPFAEAGLAASRLLYALSGADPETWGKPEDAVREALNNAKPFGHMLKASAELKEKALCPGLRKSPPEMNRKETRSYITWSQVRGKESCEERTQENAMVGLAAHRADSRRSRNLPPAHMGHQGNI